MIAEPIDLTTLQSRGALPAPTPVAAAYVPAERCRCGHEQDAHEHYRRGHDCAVCGPAGCQRYRPRRAGSGVRRSLGR